MENFFSFIVKIILDWESAKSVRPRSRYAAGFERVWTLILAWKPEKTTKNFARRAHRRFIAAFKSNSSISNSRALYCLSLLGILIHFANIPFSDFIKFRLPFRRKNRATGPKLLNVVHFASVCIDHLNSPAFEKTHFIRLLSWHQIVKQCDLKAIYDDDCFDVVRKLITVKVAKGDYDPFFVMNVEIINDVLENWFKKMPDVKPFYALRCNPDDVLLKVLTQNIDMGLCCSNRYEVEMAMKIVGVNRIIYRNPMWTRGNIRHAKECGIQTVIIETEDDLKRFTTYYSEARIILRVTMDRKMINDPLTDDNLDVEKAINLLRSTKYPSVRIRGISFSIRSICTTPTIYSYAIAQCRRLFDIGLEIAKSLHAALEFFFPSKLFKHIKIIAEPGAYFATSSFSLVTRVIDKRLIDGSFLTNDESDVGTIGYIYQINEGFYGAFGCKLLTHRNPICSPLMIFGEKMSTYAAVIGPESCDTDVILSLTRLPPLQVGDWLIWHDMGAYTIASHDISERENPSLVIQYYYRSEKIATLFSHSKTLSSEDITTETDNSSGNSVCDTSRAEFSHTNAVNIIEKQFKT
ncbi:Ornithine decarboxylase [Dirofilaria immitis]